MGAYGTRPLIAAILGPFFLFFSDFYTRERSGGPDVGHWREISAHTEKVGHLNISHLKDELDQINSEHEPLLETKEELRNPDQAQEFLRKKESIVDNFIHRQKKIDQDAFNMSILAVKPQEKVGSVTELSDRIKDFLRGKEKNRSLWVIDRGLPGGRLLALRGGVGLDQYDQTLNPSSEPSATHLNEREEKVDLPSNLEKEEVGLKSNQKQGGIEKGDPLAKDGGGVHVEDQCGLPPKDGGAKKK